MGKKSLKDPDNFWNRELSWILFNKRVLGEARDKQIPLFERMKFLSITASNLDEFFMIRVASLKDMVNAKYDKADIAGLTPLEQLKCLNQETHKLVALQYSTYNRSLYGHLFENGLHIIRRWEDLSPSQGEYADRYFKDNVYPVLTPMAVDSSRPFPLIRNKTLNIGALVSKKGEKGKKKTGYEFATVQVPGVLPRIVQIPTDETGKKCVILLEEIIERNIHKLFLNYNILTTSVFRIMRNADLTIEEDEAADLLKEIEKQIKKRQWGQAIRLETEKDIDKRLLKMIRTELEMEEEEIYYIDGPLDLTFLLKMYELHGFDHLKNIPFQPQPVWQIKEGVSIFDAIKKEDILLHHPYQSFLPVIQFVQEASKDKSVLAIKQTLYRVSGNSPIIAALAQAAENGKQVTVLVELKARFDEENNIVWAKKLEHAGCHVIYGLVGLKTHSKITLVVRQEKDGIRRYVHLGTGNYNDATAKLYSDIGLFTCKEAYGEDATAVFNMLSGYSQPLSWNKLCLAPLWLKDRFLYLIDRERQNAEKGYPSRIIAKVNSLCDRDIIIALYEASNAGVSIDLIVRGICSLKVSKDGVSKNIRVHSIVGNFLEHSRIFYFENHKKHEIYCGSADWMPRNLERRVEILFPIEQPDLKERVMSILQYEMMDNVKAHMMQKDGTYAKVDRRGRKRINSQELLCMEAMKNENKTDEEQDRNESLRDKRFIPEIHVDRIED